MRGLMVVFEGPDGCGKTTQLELLSKHLTKLSMDHVCVRLPGGSAMGATIRHLVMSHDASVCEMDHLSRLLLILADMRRTIYEVIDPALEEGKVVLCDRFVASTMGYQIHALGLDPEVVHHLLQLTTSAYQAHVLQLVFDATDKTLDSRAKARGVDVFEDMDRLNKLKMRNFYRSLFRTDTVHIDAEQPLVKVHSEVVLRVMPQVYEIHSQNLLEASDV